MVCFNCFYFQGRSQRSAVMGFSSLCEDIMAGLWDADTDQCRLPSCFAHLAPLRFSSLMRCIWTEPSRSYLEARKHVGIKNLVFTREPNCVHNADCNNLNLHSYGKFFVCVWGFIISVISKNFGFKTSIQ